MRTSAPITCTAAAADLTIPKRWLMAKALKKLARKNGFLYVLYNLSRLIKGYYPIFLEYPEPTSM